MRFLIYILLIVVSFSNKLCAQEKEQASVNSLFKIYLQNNFLVADTANKRPSRFYKKYISKQISANCEFECTCSTFMNEAIFNFGTVKGFLIGIDRLSRCGSSHNTYNFLPSLSGKNDNSLIDEIHFYD
jgi:putative component of membrane protein insertase Oxa1/YidC/SpoIIIJ protein YidD